MPRIDYARSSSADDYEIRLRRGGELRPLDKMLLHSVPIAVGWNKYLGAIRTETVLPGDIRELVILRVAVLNSCSYEWDAHKPVALAEGLRQEVIAEISTLGPQTSLTEREKAVCALTDAMSRHVQVPAEVFAAVHAHFSDREMVEVIAVIATYNMVSRFLEALQIGNEITTKGTY